MTKIKICIFSDSHNIARNMLCVIGEQNPDIIIHLGDGERDIAKIESQFPKIPLYAVKGNCDIGSVLPDKHVVEINGVKFFMAHGHTYNVKNGLTALLNAAHFSGANLVLYGHTHLAKYEEHGDLCVLNPGTCGQGYLSLIHI